LREAEAAEAEERAREAEQAALQDALEAEAAAAAEAAEGAIAEEVLPVTEETAPVEAAPDATVEAPVQDAEPTTEEEAQAEAPAAETAAEGSVTSETLSPEDEAALAAAREAAAAAELDAAATVDPVVEAEAQIAAEAEAAEQALQSLAIAPESAAASEVVTEVITEETARQPDEEFGAIMTAVPDPTVAAPPQDSDGLSGIEGAILGGIAGLVVGSILSGNRQVVNQADDRIVVLRPDGDYQVIRDDDALLRRPGNSVVTESFADGSSRNIINQPDGTQVITVRGSDLQILRRTVVAPDGTRTVLIDDTLRAAPVVVSQLPQVRPGSGLASTGTSADAAALAAALQAQGATAADRGFSLAQVRAIRAVRDLAPAVNLEDVTFATGSAAITSDQAAQLLSLGRYMSDAIARNPGEIFLIEGHTDAVGSAAYNLALSDRRAETVALALSEYFGVPPQNMVIQGYGEDFLLIPTLDDERLNRRVAVRRITDLLRVAAAN
jgi:outer membrane protein OmpA-like peptidoglycan-associated protein